MNSFLTILAWVFGLLALIRLVVIIFVTPDEDQRRMIHLAEAAGHNPVGVALIKTAFVLFLAVAWLLSHYFGGGK